MIAGMGWLLDLCPPPEELVLAEMCKSFGVLPSQVKTQEDWETIINYNSLRNLQANYQAWHQMVQNPEMSMDQDLIQWMLGLIEKAREKYGR